MTKMTSICAAAAVMILAGCSSYDGKKIRQRHAEDYPKLLDERAEEVLSNSEPLNL